MNEVINLPAQQLSFKAKNKAWRKKHLDWCDQKSYFNYSPVRKSVRHKKINYDLLDGKLHMPDLELIINPEGLTSGFIPDNIQHYTIINSKLRVLQGEEGRRVFDWRAVITNPTALSKIEENKNNQFTQMLQQAIQNESSSEEEYQQEVQRLSDYFMYSWQDKKEQRDNFVLNHCYKELNIQKIFNDGFVDAMAVGEEIYQCDIVGGEPIIERLDPLKIRIFRSGYSNKIEDADVIILEDYWSPGRIIDTYYDVLTAKDRKYIEELPNKANQAVTDEMDNLDQRYGFINTNMITDEISTSQDGFFFDPFGEAGGGGQLLPFDTQGNVRVLRMYWKSRRKIKEVKSYNPITGEEQYDFQPETYVINEAMGEEEKIFWINEAWEGTKIGEEIYVNMRPRPVQYNRLSNPSRCHFGIVGSIYNINNSKPFSLVDMMKPYSYLYDVIHDRLNKLIAHNWGAIIQLDLAKVPTGWDINKWMYYAKVNNIAVVDSFKEGNIGAATGKLAGAMNNASSGVIAADQGNTIQQYVNLLEFIKAEMSEVAGISKQREGQISNRETVGGVERATLQSSLITEWLFIQHDDVKRRALQCFLETCKIAMKGKTKKFQYILPDGAQRIVEIDGDEFSEEDAGIVIDNSEELQQLKQKIDMLAQAGLQNQMLSFSTIMKLYTTCSMSEKIKMVERDEQQMKQAQQQAQEQQMQMQQQQMQIRAQMEQAKMEQEYQMNDENNQTKIIVASIQAESRADDGIVAPEGEQDKTELMEKMRQFDQRLKLDRDRLNFDKEKARKDQELKAKQIAKQSKSTNKK